MWRLEMYMGINLTSILFGLQDNASNRWVEIFIYLMKLVQADELIYIPSSPTSRPCLSLVRPLDVAPWRTAQAPRPDKPIAVKRLGALLRWGPRVRTRLVTRCCSRCRWVACSWSRNFPMPHQFAPAGILNHHICPQVRVHGALHAPFVYWEMFLSLVLVCVMLGVKIIWIVM